MKLTLLLAVLALPLTGLVSSAATTAPTATGPAALAAGTGTVNVNEVVVVRRSHRRHHDRARVVHHRRAHREVIVRHRR